MKSSNEIIKMAFYNTALLSISPPRRDPASRAIDIGKRMFPEYDFIGCCEVWTDDYKVRLEKNFSGEYYSYYDDPVSRGLMSRTGLYAMSKTKIKEKMISYDKGMGCGWDRFVKKGVMHTRIKSRHHSNIDVFITHLQADKCSSADKSRKIRNRQIDQLITFIKRRSAPSTPVIIMGDFNIRGGLEEDFSSADYEYLHNKLNEYGPIVDVNKYYSPKTILPTVFDENSCRWADKRLDYIWISDPTVEIKGSKYILDVKHFDVKACECNPSTGYCTPPLQKHPKKCTLSDHGVVELTVEWRNKV